MPVTMRRRTCGALRNALDVDADLRTATHAAHGYELTREAAMAARQELATAIGLSDF
jgi:hypothetical protein